MAQNGASLRSFRTPLLCKRAQGSRCCTRAVGRTTASKAEVLQMADKLQRGLIATEEDIAAMESMISSLERQNPNKNSLEAPEINGRWKLVYTTSQSILGQKRPAFLRPLGPIYQTIDVPKLRARNNETWPYFNAVDADLTPESKSKVAVQFRMFKLLNLLPVPAPDSARGELDTTYVDDTMRISRGDKGNVFVLTMDDSSARL